LDYLFDSVRRNTARRLPGQFSAHGIAVGSAPYHTFGRSLDPDPKDLTLAVSATTALVEAGYLVAFGIRTTLSEFWFGFIEARRSFEPVGYRAPLY